IDVFVARSDQPEMNAGTPKHLFYRHQVVASAHEAGHYADLAGFVGQLNLRIRLEGMQLSYLVSMHGAGVESGVMAITSFGVVRTDDPDSDSIDVPTTTDAFYYAYSESIEALNGRAKELQDLLDDGLTVALTELMKRI